MSTHVSIVIDKRRSNKNKARKPTFPIRLRVYDSVLNEDKRYKLSIDMTADGQY
jgi:hypothetical protein